MVICDILTSIFEPSLMKKMAQAKDIFLGCIHLIVYSCNFFENELQWILILKLGI
jgi:hypothetical protein